MNGFLLCLAATAAIMLVGCGDAPEEGRLAVTESIRVERATGYGMSPGKPRPPVEVTLESGPVLEPGVPAEISFRVRFPEGIQINRIEVEGSEGLTLQGAPALKAAFEVPGMEVFQVARFGMNTTPVSGGLQRLTGMVHFTVNGVVQAAPFAIAVPVAGAAVVPRIVPKARVPEVDVTGEAIHSVKAETKIR